MVRRLAPSRIVALALLCAVAGACQRVVQTTPEPLVTDRPDFTESSDAVAAGHVQVESGATFTKSGESKSHSLGEVLVRVGILSRAELRIGLNSFAIDRTGGVHSSGFEDAAIGVKYRFAEGGGKGSIRPAMAFIAMTSLPTGGAPFRQPLLQPGGKLTAAWDITDRASFSSNVNYFMVRSSAATSGEWASSGSLGISLTDRVGSYFEYFGFYPTASGAAASHYANAGVTLGIGPNLQVDARAGTGLRNVRGSDYFIGLGVARRW